MLSGVSACQHDHMQPTVAFVNQKGGVGKTTVTLGMASAALEAGHRVLVVDLDPQASATWVLGVDPADTAGSIAEVLESGKSTVLREVVVSSEWSERVDVVPSNKRVIEHEVSTGRDSGLLRVRRALAGVADRYHVVLIDCPPSLGAVTLNGLNAAGFAVMVVEPASLGLRGVEAVADTIDGVWASTNPDLDLAGVIVNKVPAVSVEAERQYEALGKLVGKRSIWQPVIPQRVIVSTALADRTPIHRLGARAADVSGAFDQLYSRLWRVMRKTR